MITPDDFREVALSMQDAIEGAHMGHPDFRVNGRIFASLHTGDTFGMVSLTPEEQREFMWLKPQMFAPSAGAWGRQGATNVILAEADKKTLHAAMLLAWERTVAKPPARKRTAKVAKIPQLARVARPSKTAKPSKAARSAETARPSRAARSAKAATTARVAGTAKAADSARPRGRPLEKRSVKKK